MIRSYKNKTTETVAKGKCPKGFPADLVKVAVRKPTMIEFAAVSMISVHRPATVLRR